MNYQFIFLFPLKIQQKSIIIRTSIPIFASIWTAIFQSSHSKISSLCGYCKRCIRM